MDEWTERRTDGQTDGGDCITSHANAAGNTFWTDTEACFNYNDDAKLNGEGGFTTLLNFHAL